MAEGSNDGNYIHEYSEGGNTWKMTLLYSCIIPQMIEPNRVSTELDALLDRVREDRETKIGRMECTKMTEVQEHQHRRDSLRIRDDDGRIFKVCLDCGHREYEDVANVPLNMFDTLTLHPRDLLVHLREWLNRHRELNTRHFGDSDRSGHPHGYAGVVIPEWDVRQRLDEIEASIQLEPTPYEGLRRPQRRDDGEGQDEL